MISLWATLRLTSLLVLRLVIKGVNHQPYLKIIAFSIPGCFSCFLRWASRTFGILVFSSFVKYFLDILIWLFGCLSFKANWNYARGKITNFLNIKCSFNINDTLKPSLKVTNINRKKGTTKFSVLKLFKTKWK